MGFKVTAPKTNICTRGHWALSSCFPVSVDPVPGKGYISLMIKWGKQCGHIMGVAMHECGTYCNISSYSSAQFCHWRNHLNDHTLRIWEISHREVTCSGRGGTQGKWNLEQICRKEVRHICLHSKTRDCSHFEVCPTKPLGAVFPRKESIWDPGGTLLNWSHLSPVGSESGSHRKYFCLRSRPDACRHILSSAPAILLSGCLLLAVGGSQPRPSSGIDSWQRVQAGLNSIASFPGSRLYPMVSRIWKKKPLFLSQFELFLKVYPSCRPCCGIISHPAASQLYFLSLLNPCPHQLRLLLSDEFSTKPPVSDIYLHTCCPRLNGGHL